MQSSAKNEDKLLKKREVAERLSCHPRTIERLVASGRLHCVKLLGAVRFRLSDVERIIQEGIA